jgi:hypothetical protein
MRSLLLAALLLTVGLPAYAAHQQLICADCRDVREHPRDYGNYAYNMLIEPLDDDFSIFRTYSTSTYVWSPDKQWALVSLVDIIENTGVSLHYGFISFPVEKSTEFVRITVQDMFGEKMTYEVFETSRPLVVGSTTTAPPPSPPPSSTTKFNSSKGSTSGEEIICCQDGTYYWYYDKPAFSMQFGNE